MSTYPPDDRIEEMLRSMLQEQADAVHPAGDGLARIQQRVARRRARLRWLRPMAVVGSAAALTAAGLGVYSLVGSPANDGVSRITPVSPKPSQTTSTPEQPVAMAHFPARAIFPFTSAAQEQAWEAGNDTGSGASTIAAGDPKQVAVMFASDFLGEPSVATVTDTTLSTDGSRATVTLGRTLRSESRQMHDVTTVDLLKWRKAWVVVGAQDAGGLLAVTSPTPGETVTSPLTVTGPGFGVDEAVGVQVLTALKGSSANPVSHVSFGSGTPQWSTSVRFGAGSEQVGAVVLVDDSAADGLPGRITVVPVRFSSAAGGGYPARFVGIKNGRVTVFASRNGAALSYLTGSGASDPQVEGGTVYYLHSAGSCGTTVMSVPVAGGAPTTVARPDSGYAIKGYAVTSDGTKTALFEAACAGASPQGKLVARDVGAGGETTVTTFPAFPPMLLGDPSWEPDGVHVDAFVREGMMGGISRFDTSAQTQQPAATCNDVGPMQSSALQVDRTGTLWFTDYTGSATEVRRCVNGTSSVAFTVRSRQPQDLAVSPDGSVLLSDVAGKLWRWSGGSPVPLHPSVPMTDVSW